MNGGNLLDQIEIGLRDKQDNVLTIYIDVVDNSLSRKWLAALNTVLREKYLLEKNYCFLGFVESDRHGWYILDQVNQSIQAINQADLGYQIQDSFSMENCMTDRPVEDRLVGRNIVQQKFNTLHHYFEELQGTAHNISPWYLKSDSVTRWHIRQLNLLCHEFESWALNYRKQLEGPEWSRPSQLMCWLDAPRFQLDENDLDLFGIETINRATGGVFVGVNKAVGKHHWEVFNDEGRDSRLDELTTQSMHSQTLAAADFDIEWGRNPNGQPWQHAKLKEFAAWLELNGFDPQDPRLTIGHPQVAQVDLARSFGTEQPELIWQQLGKHLDVISIRTTESWATYDYRWSDADFAHKQISFLDRKNT